MIREDKYSKTLLALYDLQKFSIKMGLDNITHLCEYLGNPHRSYPSIHIAGTNGKGSTSILIQKILAAHGLKTGLYTSPHLVDFRERIRINEDLIDTEFIPVLWAHLAKRVDDLKATFFDATTAIAFKYFQDKQVDIAVIETGLGGRLDSTNIIQPAAVVLTPIDIDHVKQLGSDLRNIASEKSAIIKEGTTLFTAGQHPQVEEVIDQFRPRAKSEYRLNRVIRYRIISSSPQGMVFEFFDQIRQENFANVRLNLLGEFQIENALVAYLCSRWYLENRSIRFDHDKLYDVFTRIQWPGRMQQISKHPLIYFDVSHNYAGFSVTLDFIRSNFDLASAVLLLGLLADKEYERIIQLLAPDFNRIVLTEPNSDRKLDGNILKELFSKYGKKADFIKDIQNAFDLCIRNMGDNDTMFVMGSHFLIGELSKRVQEKSLTSK